MFVCFARDAAMRAYPSQVSSLLTYFTRHGGGLVCLVARTAGLTLVGASLFASELQLLELLRATRPLLSTLRFNFSRELLCFSALLFSFASALLFSFASALLEAFLFFRICFSSQRPLPPRTRRPSCVFTTLLVFGVWPHCLTYWTSAALGPPLKQLRQRFG